MPEVKNFVRGIYGTNDDSFNFFFAYYIVLAGGTKRYQTDYLQKRNNSIITKKQVRIRILVNLGIKLIVILRFLNTLCL